MAIVIFDIDGVVRDVGGSYHRALADTVEHYTGGAYRPSSQEIDTLKAEGLWNNDWEASREMIRRYYATQGSTDYPLDYAAMIAWFQQRYRGPDPQNWTGYICQEPLLMSAAYGDRLTQAGILWGFFSGATRASATYVLEQRIGLHSPVLVAMEDAPGKPDPTGLFMAVEQVLARQSSRFDETAHPVVYAGDTVADMYTVQKAREQVPDRPWIAVGVLPPHVQEEPDVAAAYRHNLLQAGAQQVIAHVEELDPACIQQLVSRSV